MFEFLIGNHHNVGIAVYLELHVDAVNFEIFGPWFDITWIEADSHALNRTKKSLTVIGITLRIVSFTAELDKQALAQ